VPDGWRLDVDCEPPAKIRRLQPCTRDGVAQKRVCSGSGAPPPKMRRMQRSDFDFVQLPASVSAKRSVVICGPTVPPRKCCDQQDAADGQWIKLLQKSEAVVPIPRSPSNRMSICAVGTDCGGHRACLLPYPMDKLIRERTAGCDIPIVVTMQSVAADELALVTCSRGQSRKSRELLMFGEDTFDACHLPMDSINTCEAEEPKIYEIDGEVCPMVE